MQNLFWAVPINSRRWPSVAQVPAGPVAAASAVIADRLLRRAAVRLPLRLVHPGGVLAGAGGVALPTMMVNRPAALARRIGRHGWIGFGESYMAGDWDCDDLAGLLTVLATAAPNLVPREPRRSRARARRGAAAQRVPSGAVFAEFLDETMTYSGAWFAQIPASWSDLAAAQRRKIDRLLEAARVGPGSRVLEIGTAGAELCLRAAARGAQVRSVTPSVERHISARRRIVAAGLADRVRVDLCDYGDVDADRQGRYDAVVSVEVLEEIGYRAWPDYFAALDRLVAPAGRVAIQTVTVPHARMLAGRKAHTWVRKYVRPGGLIPSTQAIHAITARRTSLRTVDMVSLRPHYAETLRLWRERFMQRRITLSHMGFDAVFARMWEFYLASREAGFRSGRLDVYQWTFAAHAA